jgi:hypothetical protein
MGVILMEGLAVEEMEVVPVIIADLERAQTPLFLRDSDLMDMPFALEATKDRERTQGAAAGARRAVVMMGPLGLWMGTQWSSKHWSFFFFLPCLSLLFTRLLLFLLYQSCNLFCVGNTIFLCVL